jgi:hypothetical protein
VASNPPTNVMPYVVELVAEAFRIGMREYSERRKNELEREQSRIAPPSVLVEVPHIGCPYCAIARSVASAHLYVSRLLDRPELEGIYRELASDQLDDAMDVTSSLGESIPNAELLGMLRSVKTLLGATPIDARALQSKLWSAASAAMYLAESKRYDKGATDGPRLAPA